MNEEALRAQGATPGRQSESSVDSSALLDRFAVLLHAPKERAFVGLPSAGDWVLQRYAEHALGFYRRSACNRRSAFVRGLLPRFWRSLSEVQRTRLIESYLADNSGSDLDWSINAGRFLHWVRALEESGLVRSFQGVLARHEWRLVETRYADHEDSSRLEPGKHVEALAVNPSIDCVSYPFDPLASDETDAQGETLVAYYRMPSTYQSRALVLGAAELAAIRCVEESLDLDSAAHAAGVSHDRLVAILMEYASAGLFVHRAAP